MAYAYKPKYYSSFQDTVTSICKSILPFSFKSRLLQADQKQAKRHADNLKWQQGSFHRILHLVGLHNEGIVPEAEVSAFRCHLLDTLIASPTEVELPTLIRDKLLFLKELLYAKCISSDEYHSSKRPLLQRLSAQGVEIDCRDVIVGDPPLLKNSEEQWSDIDLNDQEPPKAVEKVKENHLKLLWRGRVKKAELDTQKKKEGNGVIGSIHMPQSTPLIATTKYENNKRKPVPSLFEKEKLDEDSDNKNLVHDCMEKRVKTLKKQWGFEGLKKWKRSSIENDSMRAYLSPGEKSDDASLLNQCKLISSPMGEGPDKKRIRKREIHSDGSSSDFFIDKVLGENIKKELSRIQSELSATNQNLNFSDDQIEAISMKLPVDKADLNKFFPKSWCSTYGDIVLDVVKKEFEDHVGEMENIRNTSKEKHDNSIA